MSGGFISMQGSFSSTKLAEVTEPANRGSRALRVSNVQRLNVGDEFRMTLSETDDQSLIKHFYGNDFGAIENLGHGTTESFTARITDVNSELKEIQFDRPLRTDVRLCWRPTLYPASSSVEDVGIEGMSFAQLVKRPTLAIFLKSATTPSR